MGESVSRPEMEQFEKRVGEGFTHVNNSLTGIEQVLQLLTGTMTDLKVTQERVVTSMEEQEKILAKVTDTEERCTHIEREIELLKIDVTANKQQRLELLKEEKERRKWTKRIAVTFVLGIISTVTGFILKNVITKGG